MVMSLASQLIWSHPPQEWGWGLWKENLDFMQNVDKDSYSFRISGNSLETEKETRSCSPAFNYLVKLCLTLLLPLDFQPHQPIRIL